MTLYEILEVPEDATDDQIRAAFRKKAKEWHPDRNKRPDAGEMMVAINHAYEILSDRTRRSQYDAELARRRRPMNESVVVQFAVFVNAGSFTNATTSSSFTSGNAWFSF